jgi:hypothetical protein
MSKTKDGLMLKALALYLVNEESISNREAVTFALSVDGDNIDRVDCELVKDCGTREFSVFTDDEADAEVDACAENYADEVVYELPKHLRRYFDYDAFMSDYKDNGRGSILSGWDGSETDITINGETFYIFKN